MMKGWMEDEEKRFWVWTDKSALHRVIYVLENFKDSKRRHRVKEKSCRVETEREREERVIKQQHTKRNKGMLRRKGEEKM